MIVFSGNPMLLFQIVDIFETLKKHNKEKVILIANESTEFFFRDNPYIQEIFVIPDKFSVLTAIKLYVFMKKHASYFTNHRIVLDIYPSLYSIIIKSALRSLKYFHEQGNHYVELHKDNSYLVFYDQICALLLSIDVKMIDNIYQQQAKNKIIDLPWLCGDVSKYHISSHKDYFCILPTTDEFFNNQVMQKTPLQGMGIKKLAISVVQIYMDTGLHPIFLANFNDKEMLKEYQDIILDYCPMADIYFNVLDEKQIISVGKFAEFTMGNLNNTIMFLAGMGCSVTTVCESNLMTSIYRATGSNLRIVITENIAEIPTTSFLNNIGYLNAKYYPQLTEDMDSDEYQEYNEYDEDNVYYDEDEEEEDGDED